MDNRWGDQLKKDIEDSVHARINRPGWSGRSRPAVHGIVLGAIIVGVGTLLLLDNMGVLHAGDFWRFWPVLLIAFGLAKIADRRTHSTYLWGGILIVGGTLFLLDNLDLINFNVAYFWPLVLIAFGVNMLFRAVERQKII